MSRLEFDGQRASNSLAVFLSLVLFFTPKNKKAHQVMFRTETNTQKTVLALQFVT